MPAQIKKSPRWLIPVVLICLAIILLNFLIQIRANKSYQVMDVDSSVFAYCGQQILTGHLLYRDCFDNKPPAVYYINALAILLLHPSPGGIWLFQAIWMAITAVSFFLIMRWVWGGWAAVLATLVFMGTALDPAYYQNGNHTESYVLLPLVLIIGSLYGYLSSRRRRYLAGLGLMAAFAFLLKPTYISLGAAAGLVALIAAFIRKPWRQAAGHGALMIGSGLVPLAVVAIYFQLRGGLNDLMFAVFTHNTQYIQQGFTLWQAKQTVLKFILAQPMTYLFGLGLAAGLVFIGENWRLIIPEKRTVGSSPLPGNSTALREISLPTARRWLVFAALLSVPFEIFFVTISGRDFGHYYLLPIPALAAASAYLFSAAITALPDAIRQKSTAGLAAAAILIVFAIPWGNEIIDKEQPHRADLASYFTNPAITTYHLSQLEQFIYDHSRPDQSVLVWSTHPSFNLVTGRRSPTRYVYALHVLTPTPTGPSGFPELLRSLAQDPPALIVAQKISSVGLPDFWSADDASQCAGCTPQALQGLMAFKAYVNDHYTLTTQIFDWYVYRQK